jgi:hypothetical protein
MAAFGVPTDHLAQGPHRRAWPHLPVEQIEVYRRHQPAAVLRLYTYVDADAIGTSPEAPIAGRPRTHIVTIRTGRAGGGILTYAASGMAVGLDAGAAQTRQLKGGVQIVCMPQHVAMPTAARWRLAMDFFLSVSLSLPAAVREAAQGADVRAD